MNVAQWCLQINSWEVRQVSEDLAGPFTEGKVGIPKIIRHFASFRNMSGTGLMWNTCTNTDSVLLYNLAVGDSESCLRGRVSFQAVSTQEPKYILTWQRRPWHYRLLVHKKLLSLFVWVYRQWIWLVLYHIVMITTGKEKIYLHWIFIHWLNGEI